MDSIANVFALYGPWLWFAAGVALLVLETIVPGVHFLWFGLAAGAVGALALATPLAWPMQLILFALISIASVFVVRRFARPENAATDEPSLNIRGAQYIGRRVEVVDAIHNGRGKVRVGDTVWGAQGEDAPAGAEVEVTGVNGTVLVVSRIEAD
jgi:membrane protein implicated in regulation of membrane protease activity